jgi:uncharacterized protein
MNTRREMLKSFAAMTAAMMLPRAAFGEEPEAPMRDRLGELMPQRRFGKTGKYVSMLCLGGAHVGGYTVKDEPESERIIEECIAAGMRFFETAELYGAGESERRFGKFLTPKYRDVIFLATKTTAEDAKTAWEHLDGSLKRMNTDYLDLWQIHQIADPADVDKRLDGGVLDVMLEAREQGKVKHIGFTGHREVAAHLRMLERAPQLETCLMPVNVLDPSYKSFTENVLPVVLERDMGVQAIKSVGAGRFFHAIAGPGDVPATRLIPERLTLAEAMNFVWSLPISSRIIGVDNIEQIREHLALVREFNQLDEEDRMAIVERVADLAGGEREQYKA